MARAFLVVLDSVGAGGAPDADRFFNGDTPDTGANTLGHIAEACAEGRSEEGRSGPLSMPNLDRLGLGAAVRLASGARMPGFDAKPEGIWGANPGGSMMVSLAQSLKLLDPLCANAGELSTNPIDNAIARNAVRTLVGIMGSPDPVL